MTKTDPFKYFHSSPGTICLAVMLYVRFPLSLRKVEDLLHERGIAFTHDPIFNSNVPLLLLNGAVSPRNKGQSHCPFRHRFEFVWQHLNLPLQKRGRPYMTSPFWRLSYEHRDGMPHVQDSGSGPLAPAGAVCGSHAVAQDIAKFGR